MSRMTKGGFDTGNYRNLFAELNYSESQITNKLNTLFNEIFEGPHKLYSKSSKDGSPSPSHSTVRTECFAWG
jgi:hypothetical protein